MLFSVHILNDRISLQEFLKSYPNVLQSHEKCVKKFIEGRDYELRKVCESHFDGDIFRDNLFVPVDLP